MSGGPLPLAGVKVVELARILAGPWAGQTLADLGAEVIKVESPQGDDTRKWGPPFVENEEGRVDAAYFHACNRGKQSVLADFNKPDDLAFVKRLIADADIVIENFKVGGLVRFGLDYPTLAKDHSALVYCSITGFGQTGPYAARAGYDVIVQGMSGMMDLTGDPDGPPQKIGVALADIISGLYAVIGIQSALSLRERTGKGQHIDIALLDSMVGVLANQAQNLFVSGVAPRRMGNAHPNLAPYQPFPVADGHFILAVGNDGQFARLCEIVDRAELASDPDFATNPARVANRDRLIAELETAFSGWTKQDILAACEAAGIPAGPINALDDVFDDPQVLARGLRIDLPGGTSGVRTPIRFSDAALQLNVPAPALGQHDETARCKTKTRPISPYGA
ncbi:MULTISPECIES: CaiB/BaiF CoA transferase family protein [unclassified Sphingobium]|nr:MULTISPECIES: CoA transferase [unclassified Sphingobium]MBG6120624.1 crotonobetainyl-CoA:carnitine CoA-transferase CaiB-like acyl-CoA transferase [Sphingobium sp. JAI105]PSO11952.1 CoA transferase [Sphingobium sp. AEW4]TWD06683.1 crotonobetainyl-CoA:carnitine CoA-transferase CaiB-like acyl-CoA transferase [Sphingobium sp. AEW010]TWD23616.1 crotonobetainyl-CoA:carnitine CoA-transferase CaiB-like acyl-CoA transferase [Sphingobium sp. AEW013]TWD26135.1 crotonobetainyl-CoA:carnitine CoA-transfe